MNKKAVIAVIGCGSIAVNSHFPAFEKIENLRVKYACDIVYERARAMLDKYSFVENAITDYNIALADPEVEAVYVLTPNLVHYTVTKAAIEAGKHVLSEKPISSTYELAKEMKELADKHGKMLSIGVVNRFGNAANMLRDMINEGKLGNIYHVYCSFRVFRGLPGLGGHFTTKAISGGGALLDTGIHYLDLILYILGGLDVKTVSANMYGIIGKDMKNYKHNGMWSQISSDTENGTYDVEEFATGFIRTDKCTVSVNGAWAQNLDLRDTYIDFLGDKGGARFDYRGKFTFWSAETAFLVWVVFTR